MNHNTTISPTAVTGEVDMHAAIACHVEPSSGACRIAATRDASNHNRITIKTHG